MKERERIVVGSLVLLLLVFWLGFTVHQSPRFAGSLWGGVLAVTGSALMLVPLAYLFVKRIPWLKRRVTKRLPMRTFLSWHIYAGVIGPLLVLIHTGHKFESPLGIALTAMTLLVVVSGFIGRYLMTFIGQELREKQSQLKEFRAAYDDAIVEIRSDPNAAATVSLLGNPLARVAGWFFTRESGSSHPGPAWQAVRLAEAIADLEYAIRTHETFKRIFACWLRTHIVLSFVLYALMALHVWAAIHFGLRWFP